MPNHLFQQVSWTASPSQRSAKSHSNLPSMLSWRSEDVICSDLPAQYFGSKRHLFFMHLQPRAFQSIGGLCVESTDLLVVSAQNYHIVNILCVAATSRRRWALIPHSTAPSARLSWIFWQRNSAHDQPIGTTAKRGVRNRFLLTAAPLTSLTPTHSALTGPKQK